MNINTININTISLPMKANKQEEKSNIKFKKPKEKSSPTIIAMHNFFFHSHERFVAMVHVNTKVIFPMTSLCWVSWVKVEDEGITK
jgi:hypothetical protein